MSKRKLRKIVKPSRIILLIVLIAANTFAWFIYANKINNDISIHVKAWNVVFEAGETQVSDIINLSVESIYPGMDDYEYNISVYNNSEVSASISYALLEARILEDEYITVEGRSERGELVQSEDLTSDALLQKLEDDYPFTITIDISNENIGSQNGQEDFTFNVVWPFESNHDDIDTEWGIAAYNYKELHPTASSIYLKVKIYVTQNPN